MKTKPEHSRRGASGSHRWMTCPSSPALESLFAEESSIYADEGTLCHSVVAECLKNDTQAIDYLFYDQNSFNVLEAMEQNS